MKFINGKIYTADENNLWADTLVVDGEKITYVGNEENCDVSDKQTIDLKGKTVIPGIIDSHTHPAMVSRSSWHIKLPWTEDMDEVLDFIRDYAKKHPREEEPFLYFEYYPTSMFGEKGPRKEYLDSAVSDRPCICQDFGEHQHWYNSKMLEAMEITKDTPDPVPGLEMFVRDENGEPNGWGKEMVHMRFLDKLVKNSGWTPQTEMTPDLMKGFFEFFSEHGICALADGMTEGEAQLESMNELDKKGMLNTYYDGAIRFRSYEELPEKIKEVKRLSRKYTSKHIKINTMKLFLDGTNESGNSAMLSPHINDPSGKNYGEIQMDKDELANCFLLCNKEGVDVHIHMVGDRAFRTGCDAVEKAKAVAAAEGTPWTMEIIFAHCEIVDLSDIHRPAELGITIDWSCHWSGGYFGEEGMIYFPEEKWRRMYQINPIIDSGALVTFSSDVVTFYELHRADPFFSMQVAATRVDPEFPLDPRKYPGSVRPPESAKLAVADLIKGYTINGARQMHLEDKLGSLEKGKIANFDVLSDDLFTADPSKLKDIECKAVFFEGKMIYGKL
ncbi:MAG: amidohydrolase [Anaerovoracaceae bacterium]|jgi:predicted amidohydrolase YtcJ